MKMKKILPFFLVLICNFLPGFAQITITQADMPSANDTIRFSNANASTTLPYLQSGPNQTWDFSTLVATAQDIEPYKLSLQTPYAFFFLGLNKYGRKVADSLGVGAFQFKDIYNFYKKSSSAYEVEGIGLRYTGIPLPAYYSVPDKLYQFPLQYADRDSSNFKFTISLPSLGAYSQVGYRINSVEGWGSITTPYGTFNCLKVKSFIFSADSLNIGGFPLKFSRRTIEYKWLANGRKIPILEISGNANAAGAFTPTTVKYRDIPRSLNPVTLGPQAQFTASLLNVPVMEPITFNNTTSGFLLDYLWTFTPTDQVLFEDNTTDTSKNPIVSFTTPGQYTVKLKATNFFGTDEELKTNYITVFDPTSVSDELKNTKTYYINNQKFKGPNWLSEANISLFDLTNKKIETNMIGDEICIKNATMKKNQLLILRANMGKEVFVRKLVWN
jgi:hypothetical protein